MYGHQGFPHKGWHRTLDDAIPLPDGRVLRTLRDAGEYITALPKTKHDKPEWRLAATMLMEAADADGIGWPRSRCAAR